MENEENTFTVIQTYPVRNENNEIDLRAVNLEIHTTKPLSPEFYESVVKLLEKHCKNG